jgi:hypothetical protein
MKLIRAGALADVGLTKKAALTFVLGKIAKGARGFLLVHHEDHVSRSPFANGMPELPWLCPSCGEIVEDSADLTYDAEAEVEKE